MSVLTYGTLVFGPQGWLTLDFSQTPWMDDSQTDCMGTEIAINGSFLLTFPVNPMSKIASAATPAGSILAPAQALPTLRYVHGNWKPRQKLSFKQLGVEMIPSTTLVDDKNGPLVGPMRVVQITDDTYLMNLSITAHYAESNPLTGGGNVLSHRWSDEVRIDQDFMSTRTRQGKLVVSSSAFNSSTGLGIDSDSIRNTLITTAIAPGFARKYSDYKVNPNGLEMGYTFVDEEQFRMMPKGSTQADGEMQVTTQRMGSPGRMMTCWVLLRGPKTQQSAPATLVRTATAIAFRKLRQNGGFFPTKADFKEKLWKNEVMVSLTGMCKPVNAADKSFLGLQASMQGIGQVVDQQVGANPPDVGTRGTANVLLHAAAYQDPTLAQTLNKQDGSLSITGAGGNSPVGVIPGG